MKKIIFNTLILSSICFSAENTNGINKDINILASAKYFELYPIDNKPIPDGEISGDRQYIVLGTFGLQLFPNSINLDLSYSGVLSTSESWITNDDNMAYNEGEEDMSIISIYIKPLSTEYGDFGLGYNKYSYSTAIWTDSTATAVDIQQNSSALQLTGTLNEARYKAEITDYYLTYSLPSDIAYIPDGLSIKVGIEESDYPKMLGNGYFVMHPETESTYYAFGINKTFDELEDGFSFKTLMLSKSDNTHKYYSFVDSSNYEISSTSTQFELEFAYNVITSSKKQFYVIPSIKIKRHSDTDDEYKQGGVEVGFIY